MVTINRNILGLGVARQISQQSNQLSKIFEQLSSGRRLTSFSVDAAGGAIATRLESAFRGLSAQIRGDQTQVNRLQTEDAGLGSITDELQRIRELQVQAQNSAVGPEGTQALQEEINQRVQNVRGLVENTQFAGNGLIEAGPELEAILESGVAATGDPAQLDLAIEEVSAERSEVGAEINATQSRIQNRSVAFENTLASFSRISDLDFATGVTEQINAQILQQSAIGTLRNLFIFNRQNTLSLLTNI